MASIIAFAGSNSSTSINYKLVKYTASLVEGQEIQLLNMMNFPFPMYSEDIEKTDGFSNSLMEFANDISESDGLIIAVNEHNSNVSAYFKNLLDWFSRFNRNFLEGKKILLMATSPGKRGGVGALDITKDLLPRFGAAEVITFSLPSFYDTFDEEKGIKEATLAKAHQEAISQFLAKID